MYRYKIWICVKAKKNLCNKITYPIIRIKFIKFTE